MEYSGCCSYFDLFIRILSQNKQHHHSRNLASYIVYGLIGISETNLLIGGANKPQTRSFHRRWTLTYSDHSSLVGLSLYVFIMNMDSFFKEIPAITDKVDLLNYGSESCIIPPLTDMKAHLILINRFLSPERPAPHYWAGVVGTTRQLQHFFIQIQKENQNYR